jgi:hypothetical protein
MNIEGRNPVWLIIAGFVLVTIGMVIPFLLVMHLVKSTYFMNFFSFGASVAGLFLGVIGASLVVRNKRHGGEK